MNDFAKSAVGTLMGLFAVGVCAATWVGIIIAVKGCVR